MNLRTRERLRERRQDMLPDAGNAPARPVTAKEGAARTGDRTGGVPSLVLRQLRAHAPFTLAGTATGILIMAVIIATKTSPSLSHNLFWIMHPLHVLLSALVTTAMYALHGRRSLGAVLLVGYVGSIGIATLSDSIMPYAGEWLLNLPNRGVHIGFIEKWWLVNPLAFLGIALGYFWPRTKVPHAGHVLLSTWASLFHMTMALGTSVTLGVVLPSALFLFLAVWMPCCTSDIVFPLLFVKRHAVASPEFGARGESS
jgi:hypothetical protein